MRKNLYMFLSFWLFLSATSSAYSQAVKTADVKVETISFSVADKPYTITSRIHRLPGIGSFQNVSFDVSFYDGNPSSGGALIKTIKNQKLSYLPSNATTSSEIYCTVTWKPVLNGSTHDIWVIVQPKDYTDSNTTNNSMHVQKQITAPPPPSPVTGEDIGIKDTPTVQFNGDINNPCYTITTIAKRFYVYPNYDKATLVEVTCYDGPIKPANKINSATGWIPNPQATTYPEKAIAVDWYPVLDNAVHDIWIEVKAIRHAGSNGTIYTDPNLANNTIKIQITLPPPPPKINEDLAIRVIPEQITLIGTSYSIGTEVQILSAIQSSESTKVKVTGYNDAIKPGNKFDSVTGWISWDTAAIPRITLSLTWNPVFDGKNHNIWIMVEAINHKELSNTKYEDYDLTNNSVKIQLKPIIHSANTEDMCFYNCDLIGTPVTMTDIAGKTVWVGNSLPFGKEFTGEGSRDTELRYVGKPYDHSLKLYDFGARHYSPETGRFTGTDPIMGDLTNPQSLNKYAYVLNNPYKYIDPNGKEPENIHVSAKEVMTAIWSDLKTGASQRWENIRKGSNEFKKDLPSVLKNEIEKKTIESIPSGKALKNLSENLQDDQLANARERNDYNTKQAQKADPDNLDAWGAQGGTLGEDSMLGQLATKTFRRTGSSVGEFGKDLTKEAYKEYLKNAENILPVPQKKPTDF